MIQIKLLYTVILACCITTNSYSQINSTHNLPARDVFVGSTPCDALIKSRLKIPGDTPCDFIKWELSFSTSIHDSGTFQLTALYGESQPNTNGFKGGGKKISVTGKYTNHYGKSLIPPAKVCRLNGEQLESPVFLIQMDNNILHFADNDKKFIVGNGGWGYVLNRLQ